MSSPRHCGVCGSVWDNCGPPVHATACRRLHEQRDDLRAKLEAAEARLAAGIAYLERLKHCANTYEAVNGAIFALGYLTGECDPKGAPDRDPEPPSAEEVDTLEAIVGLGLSGEAIGGKVRPALRIDIDRCLAFLRAVCKGAPDV